MRVGFFLSTAGGSPLVVGLERGLAQLGHEVHPYQRGSSYDLLLIFNQCAHTISYAYPDFPDGYPRIAFIDTAEYGWTKRIMEPLSDYWNAFAPGSMTHDTKNFDQQERLRQFLDGRSFPYFAREFFNAWEFPSAYHPIDYPLYALSVSHRAPSRRDYLMRSVDVACLWGLSNPWRVNLTAELEASSFTKDVYVIERDGPRLPQFSYFRRIEEARSSISFDGYGSGSFRVTEVLCRSLLLQGSLAIKTRAPLIHGETCLGFTIWHEGPDYVRSNLVEQLCIVRDDRERAFKIHQRGYHHCMQHYTEKATAAYVLRIIEGHDWSQPTRI